jgi:hypothetical protein
MSISVKAYRMPTTCNDTTQQVTVIDNRVTVSRRIRRRRPLGRA